MKAIVRNRYGSPDVLSLKDVDKPTLTDDRVLVKVAASSINPADKYDVQGPPMFFRLVFRMGVFKPKTSDVGTDVAGTVEAVGKSVTNFKPGDEVFGVAPGAYAEFASARESKLAFKPSNASFEEAAAVPIAALTALQGLRNMGKIKPEQKVLINGASGGVGTYCIQMARAYGSEVTAVCSTRNVEQAKALGAARVIDYTKDDFVKEGLLYDLIVDIAGNHSLSAYRKILAPGGTLVMIGKSSTQKISVISFLGGLVAAKLTSMLSDKKAVSFIANVNREDLEVVKGFMESGKVTSVIEKSYPLSDVPDALRYLGEGHARGKLVVRV